jgi:thymidylate synthase
MTYILQPYDDALREILDHGERVKNRTGVDTLAICGMQKRYRIDTHFPLLTKRKVWPKSVFAELVWMLSGSTCVKDLQALGCNFWNPWVDEKFEKKHGYGEGCLGPVYGFQLRHFGGYYGNGLGGQSAVWWFSYLVPSSWKYDSHKNLNNFMGSNLYGMGGFDQIDYMIRELRLNPTSRRILFSMWNPRELSKQKLPPCHILFKLTVRGNKLSGHLFQRSADFAAGIPANISFYSALIYMFAQQTGYKAHELVHTTDDSHIYVNQINAVETYLGRSKRDSPVLELKKAKDIYSYMPDDFVVKDYNPDKPIQIPVEV